METGTRKRSGAVVGQQCVGQIAVGQVEVVLRDFDGTRTLYPTDVPLRDVIHTSEMDLGIEVGKTYVRTAEMDERGRTIYAERV
jgi:hypothetical protein